jgi:glycosyltransferase involved in cell wall biosynthesis
MRVAIVTDWFAPRRGGIEAQLGEAATRLADRGTAVAVVTSTPGPGQESPFAIQRLGVLTLPSPPLAISPQLLGALRRALAQDWDVVHAHVSVISPTGWTAAWVARSLGLPCVVTFHSVLRGKAVALRAFAAVAPIAGASVAWNAVSSSVAEQVRWALPGAAVNVLPNGTDVAWWSDVPSASGGRPLTFVATMRLHRKKRGRELVRVFADAVQGTTREAKLILVGDGPEREAIEREIDELGLRSGRHRAELLGWSDRSRLRDLYAGADAFVMASVHESFGIAALEASAAGLPVIARRSGVTEFIRDGKNGLIADSDRALAAAIRSFIDDDATRSRLTGDPATLTRFDWSAVIEAHLGEYDRAIGLASSPARAAAASA